MTIPVELLFVFVLCHLLSAFLHYASHRLFSLSVLGRLLKNAHLLRFPPPSSLRRTFKYASPLGSSGALHLGIFDQPGGKFRFQQALK